MGRASEPRMVNLFRARMVSEGCSEGYIGQTGREV